jgi:hypothetical protein
VPGTDSEVVGGITTVEVGDNPNVVGQTTVGISADTTAVGDCDPFAVVVGGLLLDVAALLGTVLVLPDVAAAGAF